MDPYTIVALVLSLGLNFWQFNSNGHLKAENEQLSAIASRCQLEKGNERAIELESARKQELVRQDISGVVTTSERRTADLTVGGSDLCASKPSSQGRAIVDETERRTREVNQHWMPGAGTPNDQKASP